MAYFMLILRNPIPCLAVTLAAAIYAAFSGFGLLSTLFTISFGILSSIFFKFLKHQAALKKAPLEEEEDEYLSQMKQISPTLHPEMETFSESESIGHSSITDQDSETEWPCSTNQGWSDDGSISDEESLIEIALPSGHFLDTENVSGLKDFSAEMNYEEDNLIEIDLSIGSIKCPRFEIKA